MFDSRADAKPAFQDKTIARTKVSVIIDTLLSEPLLLIFGLADFILCKNLHGSPFQISLLTMLKPSLGLMILYWSASIQYNRQKLRSNLIWSGILARVPFLFFPWVESSWYFIFAAGLYIFFYRANNPAWMEILKLNLPNEHRNKIYSLAAALARAEGILISLSVIPWLKYNELAWRWCFPIGAVIGMFSIIAQNAVIPPRYKFSPKKIKAIPFSFREKVTKPWKDAYKLMRERPDFSRFQIGFFLCGFGLMMSIAVIPFYCANILNISLSEFATAKLVCMCIGYVLFANFWSKKLNSLHIFEFMVYVIICFILFAIFLVLASINAKFLYVAYFVYGIGQAGSHLGWNLSGPIFARHENSAAFSSINVLMVGLRGCVAPILGSLIYIYFSSYISFTIFILLSFISIWVMVRGLTKYSLISY